MSDRDDFRIGGFNVNVAGPAQTKTNDGEAIPPWQMDQFRQAVIEFDRGAKLQKEWVPEHVLIRFWLRAKESK